MAAGVRHHCARLQLMKASIREFEPSDEEPVVGPSLRAWVAEAGVAARLARDSGVGEIYMIAVDPGARVRESARP